jgi:POT family
MLCFSDHLQVEQKRRESETPISIWWIAPQFLVFGLSEMFTAVGLIEFFYKQSLAGMQSFLTSMTYCSYSFGFYLSSVLVSLINKFTKSSTHGGWLSGNDLNRDRLDLFYWLLAALSILNFFNYLFWSRWYSTSIQPDNEYVVDTNREEEQIIALQRKVEMGLVQCYDGLV